MPCPSCSAAPTTVGATEGGSAARPDAKTPPSRTREGGVSRCCQRGVAQRSRAPVSKTGCCRFDSCHPCVRCYLTSPQWMACALIPVSLVDADTRAPSGRGRWLTRLLWEQDTPSSILGPRTVQHQARQAQEDERPVEAREVLRSIRRTGAHSTCGRSTTEVRCPATAETRVRLPATARMYLLR